MRLRCIFSMLMLMPRNMKDQHTLLQKGLVPIGTILATFSLIILVIILLTDEAWLVISWLLTGAVRSRLSFGNLLENTARLTITGLAASLALKSGLVNLGGEGQALAGGLSAAAIAMLLPNLPRIPALVLLVLVGASAGALIGSISGMLKAWWNVDEMMSSFLLAASILPLGTLLLRTKMKDAESYLIAAPPLPQGYRLAMWMPPSRFGVVFIWGMFLLITVFLFFHYTHRGYQWRLHAANPLFARYGGINTRSIVICSMGVSGALFGLGGTAVLLDGGQAVQGFTNGLGWNGLAVALIARNRPEFVPIAALVYSWLEIGTQSAMLHTGFPFILTGLIQAIVFLLITTRKQHSGMIF